MSRPGTPGSGRARVPNWVERLVVRAAGEIRVLASLTPAHAACERERLAADLRQGRSSLPRWTYAAASHDELRRALDAAQAALGRSDEPQHELYRARMRELSIEAELSAAAGTRDVARLALERFAPPEPAIAQAAAQLCATWLEEPLVPRSDPLLASDAPHPRSLLSQMREAVGKLRLPFTVAVDRSLAALAATGDRVILVAAGRFVHDDDAARTVLHEVEGHARPRARSYGSSCALLRVGTAGGVDDQEGRALVLEARAGMLGPCRKGQLAARHRAVEAMLDGASFADVALLLVRTFGLDAADAVLVAERAFRGSDGARPGLGRERIYLESFVRVSAHLGAHPEDEDVMASGQVAVDSIAAVRDVMASSELT
ncbi:MAG: tyrosine/phenylalanine carboxypeptidase domain-containing protein [Polyangiaceae bacterium]